MIHFWFWHCWMIEELILFLCFNSFCCLDNEACLSFVRRLRCSNTSSVTNVLLVLQEVYLLCRLTGDGHPHKRQTESWIFSLRWLRPSGCRKQKFQTKLWDVYCCWKRFPAGRHVSICGTVMVALDQVRNDAVPGETLEGEEALRSLCRIFFFRRIAKK